MCDEDTKRYLSLRGEQLAERILENEDPSPYLPIKRGPEGWEVDEKPLKESAIPQKFNENAITLIWPALNPQGPNGVALEEERLP